MLANTIFSDSGFAVAAVTQGSYWLLPMDAVYFFTILHLGVYALLHRNRFVSLLKENPFLSIFLAVVVLYIILCMPAYGKRAIGEARKYYFMFFYRSWL